jgi:hypothetical protein
MGDAGALSGLARAFFHAKARTLLVFRCGYEALDPNLPRTR